MELPDTEKIRDFGVNLGESFAGPVRPKRDRAAPREAPPDKPLDGPTTKTEVSRALCVTYNLLHRILHDDIRYLPADFTEEADGFMELLQQHSKLRIALRIIAPLAAFGAIYEKVEGTVQRFRERQAAAKRARQQAKQQTVVAGVVTPVEPNGPNHPGLTAEQIANRPFGR